MATLPMDIIVSCILPKLPAKSLLRFKCVSKSFVAEISSPKLIKLHHLNALSSNDNRLLILEDNKSRFYMYDLDSPHSPPSVFYYPKPITFTSVSEKIVASCECYFLIGCGRFRLDGLILVNPFTCTYRELPLAPVPHNVRSPWGLPDPICGMCHCVDEFDDDYKVVRFLDFKDNAGGYLREVMVYSLRTNLWKLVECEPTVETIVSLSTCTPVLVQNHLLHMIFVDGHYADGHMKRIGCFDIKAEKWANDVPFPDIVLGDDNFICCKPYLGVLDGQLCYLDPIIRECTYEFWVMKDYGVKESWVKLVSLADLNDKMSPWSEQGFYHPVAYRNRSPHELLCRRGRTGQFLWYSLRNKETIEAGINGVPDYWYSLAIICKGSLLNFSGGQPIRASAK